MRQAVYEDTGFRCSAGIAHNKVGLSVLFRYLGGKIGTLVTEHLRVENMADLIVFSERALQQLLGKKNGNHYKRKFISALNKTEIVKIAAKFMKIWLFKAMHPVLGLF
ncbi:hypothetical protein DPMN_094404 [Dreissena polymorpha]|uniref:Uncharacterized protein n=1 Tax=Dreissena polymorpha TaxID=45954 RepID=A0A9D4L4Q1_DREPO|nr:hypothetical protein DPMN_094404 [Dreissena polymorpha]